MVSRKFCLQYVTSPVFSMCMHHRIHQSSFDETSLLPLLVCSPVGGDTTFSKIGDAGYAYWILPTHIKTIHRIFSMNQSNSHREVDLNPFGHASVTIDFV